MANRWAYDPDREAEWQRQIRVTLIRDAVARPNYWAPIIARWKAAGREGIEDLARDIRAAWKAARRP